MAVSMVIGLHPWTANINDTQYLAAQRAIKTGGTDILIHPFAAGPETLLKLKYQLSSLSVLHWLRFSSGTESIE